MKNIVLTSLLLLTSPFALSSELETLTAGYEREKARVLAPVELKYDAALRELKLKYTQAGRLEEAIAVTEILESRSSEEGGDWLRDADTLWKWQSGGQFTLQKNQRALHTSWKKPGKWSRIDEDTIEVIDDRDRKYTITFKDRKSAEVSAQHGGGTMIFLVEE